MATSTDVPRLGSTHATRSTKHKEDRYLAFLEAAPDAMVVVDEKSSITLLNSQAEKQFGYSRDELLGQNIRTIIPEGFSERLIADDRLSPAKAAAQQMGSGIELIGRRKDETEFPIEIMLAPVDTTEGLLVIAAIRNISKRRADENKIIALNRTYKMLSGVNTLIVRVKVHDELFRDVCQIAIKCGGFNQAWIGLIDDDGTKISLVASAGIDKAPVAILKDRYLLNVNTRSKDSMVVRAVRDKIHIISNDVRNDPHVALDDQYPGAVVNSIAVLPLIIANKSVGILALYSHMPDFFDDVEIKLLSEIAEDISFAIDNINKQEQLEYHTYYDALTGLANRKLFLERVSQYMRSAKYDGHKLALYMIDIEGFKNINDTHGEVTGNLLLQEVAKWLSDEMEDPCLVAHIDAEHFALVQPKVNHESEVARMTSKSLSAFEQHTFHLDDTELRIAAKAGVAIFPDDATTSDELMKKAEVAIKKTSESNSRFLFYRHSMTVLVAERLALETQLRTALEREQFVLHYQPQISLLTGKLVGAEALIRWNDPKKGLIPPGQFIPVLEETGLIQQVGLWVLQTALEDRQRWRAAGLPALRFAVNISSLQLASGTFIAELQKMLGSDPDLASGLELEITESLIMKDVQQGIDILGAIRQMGVTIAIDDFGTGFSSLSYLARLPLDTLKIDRMFTGKISDKSEGLLIVKAIITLAKLLNLKVIAEGVETQEQLSQLKSLACDEMQGFLYSKALPYETFEAKYLKQPNKQSQESSGQESRGKNQGAKVLETGKSESGVEVSS